MATLKSTYAAINDLVGSLKSKNSTTLTIKSAEPLDNGFARIVASVTKKTDQKTNIGNAIRARFDNKLHPVENSFTLLSSNAVSDTFSGIISATPQAVDYTEETQGFRVLAGNMYADEEESLWELRATDSGKILVKTFGKEDAEYVDQLLQSCSSSTNYDYESKNAISDYESVSSSVDGGDFIIYVNPKSEQVSMGTIIASVTNTDGSDTGSVYVVDKSRQSVVVKRKMVLAKVEGVEVPESVTLGIQSVAASIDPMAMRKIEEYYKKVYGHNEAYYNKFIELFKKHSYA